MSNYISLYRKYRPKIFDEIVGQEHIVNTLKNQIKNNEIAHAYLFTGTRGTGKTSCAKIFAKAVNCLQPKDGSPCYECSVCKALDNANMDIIEIDAASNNSVEDIREMRENIKFTPVNCRYKVYIIDEVHMLSPSAFNALLKSIEEPPSHIIFILATTEVHKIPATILSRVVRLDFRLVGQDCLQEHIRHIFEKEGIQADELSIREIARLGEGSVRDAFSIAECVNSYANKHIKYEDVLVCMGISGRDTLQSIVCSILEKDKGKFFEIVNELYLQGKNFALLSKELVSFLRDMMICKTCKNANDILQLPITEFEKLHDFSIVYEEDKVFEVMTMFVDAESEFRYANNAKMLFESVAVLSMNEDLVKKNEQIDDEIEKRTYSPKEIWGKIMSLVYEKEYFALHALCGDLTDLKIEGKTLIVGTDKRGLAETFVNLGYKEIMQEIIKELGFDFDVQMVQKEKTKTKQEVIHEKLTKVFGKNIVFE